MDGGNFDWEAAGDRQPALNTPDPSYHGAVWSEAAKPLGPIAYILKARTTLLRDLGGAIGPFNAFMFLQGMETVPLRCTRIAKMPRKLPSGFPVSPAFPKVIYPSLMDAPMKARAEAVLNGGYGALLGFELVGGAEAGQRFIDALKMLYHVANIGDARSLAVHPASNAQPVECRRPACFGCNAGLCAAVDWH